MTIKFGWLASIVLSDYETTSSKVNCDEPFEFCSNKRPFNAPGFCEKDGGYPDDLDYDRSTSADYSQYRSAMALKPCFNKELEDLGFTGDDKFRTIDIFTTNNFRARADSESIKRNRISERDGRYNDQRSKNNQRNNLNAISIVFEEPGSRRELIDYLEQVDHIKNYLNIFRHNKNSFDVFIMI